MPMRKSSAGFALLLASSAIAGVLLIGSATAQQGPIPAPPWSTAGEETPNSGQRLKTEGSRSWPPASLRYQEFTPECCIHAQFTTLNP